MNRVDKCARLLQLKYGIRTLAAAEDDRILVEAKRDIRDVYRNYFSRSARDPMFQYASDLGVPAAQDLVNKMDKLIRDMDQFGVGRVLSAVNEILGIMYQMKNDPEQSVRQAIYDSVASGTEAQRNTRQRILSKYERSLSMAFPALQKIAIRLQTLRPDVSVQSGEVGRQRAELSKQQLVNFVLSAPAFKDFGVNSLDIVEQILSEPGLKGRLTTLINAINRQQVPLDAPVIREFADQVKKRMRQKDSTNQSVFETDEPLNAPVAGKDEE